MGLCHPARTRKNQGLRGMKRRKIGVPAGILADAGFEDDPGSRQALPRLLQMFGDFRRHSSTPSRRTSPISVVRLRQAPAG